MFGCNLVLPILNVGLEGEEKAEALNVTSENGVPAGSLEVLVPA